MIDPNAPAYPYPKQIFGTGQDYEEINGSTGLTIRQYFAAMAMQGLCANEAYYNNSQGNPKWYAHKAVEIVDETINELNK